MDCHPTSFGSIRAPQPNLTDDQSTSESNDSDQETSVHRSFAQYQARRKSPDASASDGDQSSSSAIRSTTAKESLESKYLNTRVVLSCESTSLLISDLAVVRSEPTRSGSSESQHEKLPRTHDTRDRKKVAVPSTASMDDRSQDSDSNATEGRHERRSSSPPLAYESCARSHLRGTEDRSPSHAKTKDKTASNFSPHPSNDQRATAPIKKESRKLFPGMYRKAEDVYSSVVTKSRL